MKIGFLDWIPCFSSLEFSRLSSSVVPCPEQRGDSTPEGTSFMENILDGGQTTTLPGCHWANWGWGLQSSSRDSPSPS